MSIYTKKSALTPLEIQALKENASNQNEFIFNLLKVNPDRGLAIFEVIKMTGINPNSVNRALSSMSSKSGRNSKRFKDGNGNMPIVKRKDVTSKNPQTGKTCCTYWYNEKFLKESI